jgi:hypothetical protein
MDSDPQPTPILPDALQHARLYRRATADALSVLRQYPPDRQRQILEHAWLTAASMERAARLHSPGGYLHAQADQVESLLQLVEIITATEPDIEAERLLAEHRYGEAYERAGFDVDDDTATDQPPPTDD